MPVPPAAEIPDFLAIGGRQLYYVRHCAAGRARAHILCCPPFGLERTLAYTTLVRFARYLAGHGFEVIRFDYRGTGESDGRFESCGFHDWQQDAVDVLHGTIDASTSKILLFGLRFGGLIASRLFERGLGAGLLVWQAPPDARSMLLELLLRKLAASALRPRTAAQAPQGRQAYIDQWLREGALEVDGLRWGKALWRESLDLRLVTPSAADPRPACMLQLRRQRGRPSAAPAGSETVTIPYPAFWDYGQEILPDLQHLFERSLRFLES